MRKYGLVLFLILAILAGISFRFGGSARKGEERAAEPPSLSSAITPVPVAKPKPARPSKLSGQVAKSAAGSGDSNVIEFKVVDGFAVAYGDILLGEPENPAIKEGVYDAPTPTLWERPEIPYAINPSLPNPQRIRQALDYFTQHTPVSFVPYDNQPDAISFEPGNEHCYSLLGKQGGVQPIRLSPECQWPEVVHEIMHALGFVHEQSRPDRDQYVEILWNNIEDQYRSQFQVVPNSFMEAYRQSGFDYRSVMLYPAGMFAKEGETSLRSRTNQPIAPVTDGLSPGDIERLVQLYRPYTK